MAAAPVEPRTTSSGSNSSSSLETGAPPIWPRSSETALRPIDSIGCRTVVSGGSVQLINSRVVEADHGEVARNRQTVVPRRPHDPERHDVARADDTGRSASHQPKTGGLSFFHREHAALDEFTVRRDGAQLLKRRELARRRYVVGRAEHHPDALVPQVSGGG